MAIGTNLVKTQPSFWSGMIRAFDFFGTYDENEFDLSALDPAVAWQYDGEALNNDFRKVMEGLAIQHGRGRATGAAPKEGKH